MAIRTDYPGFEAAQKIEDHKAEESSLERRENKAADLRRRQAFQKFPMHVHKPAGLWREVTNEDDLADALRKGWVDDVRKLPADELEDGDEGKIFNLPIKQAIALVKGATAEELAAIEADEAAHGGRAKVLEAIAAAKDAIVVPKAKPAKVEAPKPAKAAGKKK